MQSQSTATYTAPAVQSDPLDRFAGANAGTLMLIARILLGAIFVMSGYGKITGLEAGLGRQGVPMPDIMAIIGACVEFFGGIAVIIGLRIRYAALLMILFVIAATVISHRYWEFADAAARRGQLIHFQKNITIIGGLIALFVGGAGRFALDPWRRH